MRSDWMLLAVAVASLAVGPAFAWARPEGKAWRAFLDGLSLTLVGGLCLLHLAPHALAEGGVVALALGALGFVGPALLHRTSGAGATAWMFGGVLAVLVHSLLDGASLTLGVATPSIGMAVVAHQIPVGLGLWTLAASTPVAGWSPTRVATVALGAVMAATVVGFVVGAPLERSLSETVEGWVEAFVAGALLHVVFDAAGDPGHVHPVATVRPGTAGFPRLVPVLAGQPHSFVRALRAPMVEPHDHLSCRNHHHGHDGAVLRAWSSAGAVLGMVGIAAVSMGEDSRAHLGSSLQTLGSMVLACAPALLGGYLVAALSAALLPEAPVGMLRRTGVVGEALRGLGFGLPLPVCSCGILPLYESLVRRGVPAVAALAFLVVTPVLGADALLLSVPLLGLPFAVARLVAALLTAGSVAILVGHLLPARVVPPQEWRDPVVISGWERLRTGLRFGFVELVDHTLPWVVLGFGITALLEPLLSHDVVAGLPSALQVPLFAALGIPLYICAAGATPIVALAVHQGVSAGAALAFLLAGPATSIPTFVMLRRLHGTGPAVRFGLGVAGLAVLAGWSVDLLGLPVASLTHLDPVPTLHPIGSAAALVLAALAFSSLFRQGIRGVVGQILEPTHHH